MKRTAAVFLLALIATAASAQVTRLKPTTTNAFVYTAPGQFHVLAGWRVDLDDAARFDPTRSHCIVIDQPGEYLIAATVQWSLQNSDPQSGSRGIVLSRQPEGGGTPVALESAAAPPVQDFVTIHSVNTEATLEAGDCVFVGVKQTSGDNVFALGTKFWLAPLVEERESLWDRWRAQRLRRREASSTR